ncbi:MAG: SDR family oxidoreductase [Gammaproteobacteria bacterium]|nr:SDR family oxidoreductase [Gammaproteobacteria bacterium]
MQVDLNGKIVLITGIGSGIGREAALQFAAAGAHVVGCDLNAAGCETTAQLVREQGGKISATGGVDLGDPVQAEAWIQSAGAMHERIDVLYNNASAARFGTVSGLSVEDWRFTIRNELDLVFYAAKFAWPLLARHGGTIINVASVAAWGGSHAAGLVAHSAAKGGVVALTRQLAVEGAGVGIRAVSISPGFIATPGTRDILRDEAVRSALVANVPLGRPGEVSEVVAVALFVASGAASFITGTDIVVDGGLLSM